MKPADKNKPLLDAEEFLKAIDANDGGQDSFDEFEREAAEGLKLVKDRGRLKKIHDRIDEELKEKKKKRGIVVWFSAAASLVIVTGLIWLILPRLDKKGEVAAASNNKPASEITSASDAALDSVVSVKELDMQADSSKTFVSDLRKKEESLISGDAISAAENEIAIGADDNLNQGNAQSTEKQKLVYKAQDNETDINKERGLVNSKDGKFNFSTSGAVTNGTVNTNPGYLGAENNGVGNAGISNQNTNTNANYSGLFKTEVSDNSFAKFSAKEKTDNAKKAENNYDLNNAKTQTHSDSTSMYELALLSDKKKKEEDRKRTESSAKANEDIALNQLEEKNKLVATSPAINQKTSNTGANQSTVTSTISNQGSSKSIEVAKTGLTEEKKTGKKKTEGPAKKPVADTYYASGRKNDADGEALAMDTVASHSPAFMQEIVLNGAKKVSGNAGAGTAVNWATPDMPQYPGGFEAMQKFFRDNIKMPADQTKSTGGQVIVSFAIGKDGTVSDVKVVKLIKDCGDCTAEVKRVVLMMPKWKPGTNSGKPITMRYNLPVRF